MLTVPFDIPGDKINQLSLSLLKTHDRNLYTRVSSNDSFLNLFVDYIISLIEKQTKESPSRINDNEMALIDLSNRMKMTINDLIRDFNHYLDQLNTNFPHADHTSTCPICLIDTNDVKLPCCGQSIHSDCLILLRAQPNPKCCLCRSVLNT